MSTQKFLLFGVTLGGSLFLIAAARLDARAEKAQGA
jgi:hypothetical protein